VFSDGVRVKTNIVKPAVGPELEGRARGVINNINRVEIRVQQTSFAGVVGYNLAVTILQDACVMRPS
jgi:hypothetical protein